MDVMLLDIQLAFGAVYMNTRTLEKTSDIWFGAKEIAAHFNGDKNENL
jgi:hypothetical protein